MKNNHLRCVLHRLPILLTLLLLPSLKAVGAAATLSLEPLTIEVGGEGQLQVDLNNGSNAVTLIQFDLILPTGLTLKSWGDTFAADIVGRTDGHQHSLLVNKLANGRYRVLLSSATNAIIQGSSGAVIGLTLSASTDFSSGTVVASNILLVDPYEEETTPAECSIQVVAVAPPTPPSPITAKLAIDPVDIYQGGEAVMPIMLNNGQDQVTLVQFDLALPTGLTLKKNSSGNPIVTIGQRVNQTTHTLQTNVLGDGSLRCLLSSNTNAVISGQNGTILSVTLQATEDFDEGYVKLNNIAIVGPHEEESTQTSYQQVVTGHILEPTLATSISLILPRTELEKGDTMRATYTLQPNDVTSRLVSWESSNPQVATVDQTGLVTAVGKGTTEITVKTTDGSNKSDHKTLTVKVLATGISVTLRKSKLNKGEQTQAECTIKPDDVSVTAVSWTSDNSPVASVDSKTGLVTATGKGMAKIRATTTDGSNGGLNYYDEKEILVIVPATSISIDLPKTELSKGETMQANYTILPSEASDQEVKWVSSDEKVATVDQTGVITAKRGGKTTIWVMTTDDTHLADWKEITVKVPATGIEMVLRENELEIGQSTLATCNLKPDDVTISEVEWKSDNPSVAEVDSDGWITAMGIGTANITVSTKDRTNLKDTKKVTVREHLIKYTSNDVTYTLYSSAKTARIDNVRANRKDKVIPDSVMYENTHYAVTAIGDSAFSSIHSTAFDYSYTIPATVTDVSDKAFDDINAPAVVWKSLTKLTERHLAELKKAYPNALLYVEQSSVLPSEAGGNVVVGGVAQHVELKENTVFHCPQEFVAEHISFNHRFKMETGIGTNAGWETIVLPFTVQTITHETKGQLVPFAKYDGKAEQKPFWLYELSANGFMKAQNMEANKPYLISMPNNDHYSEGYNLNGRVNFAANHARVAKTDMASLQQGAVEHNGKIFMPAYYFYIIHNDYHAINAVTDFINDAGGWTPGSIFVHNLRYIQPFEGYFYFADPSAIREVIEITFADGQPTEIEAVSQDDNNTTVVYDLQGRLLPKGAIIHKGVYIVNGKKKIVK